MARLMSESSRRSIPPKLLERRCVCPEVVGFNSLAFAPPALFLEATLTATPGAYDELPALPPPEADALADRVAPKGRGIEGALLAPSKSRRRRMGAASPVRAPPELVLLMSSQSHSASLEMDTGHLMLA